MAPVFCMRQLWQPWAPVLFVIGIMAMTGALADPDEDLNQLQQVLSADPDTPLSKYKDLGPKVAAALRQLPSICGHSVTGVDDFLPRSKPSSSRWRWSSSASKAHRPDSDLAAATIERLLQHSDANAVKLAALLMALRPELSSNWIRRHFQRALSVSLTSWCAGLYLRMLSVPISDANLPKVFYENLVGEVDATSRNPMPLELRPVWRALQHQAPLESLLDRSRSASSVMHPATWADLFIGLIERVFLSKANDHDTVRRWSESVRHCAMASELRLDKLQVAALVRFRLGAPFTVHDLTQMVLYNESVWYSNYGPFDKASSYHLRVIVNRGMRRNWIKLSDLLIALDPTWYPKIVASLNNTELFDLHCRKPINEKWFRVTGVFHECLLHIADAHTAYSAIKKASDFQRIAVALYYRLCLNNLDRLTLSESAIDDAINALLVRTSSSLHPDDRQWAQGNRLFQIVAASADTESRLMAIARHPRLTLTSDNILALADSIDKIGKANVAWHRLLDVLIVFREPRSLRKPIINVLTSVLWRLSPDKLHKAQWAVNQVLPSSGLTSVHVNPATIAEDEQCPFCWDTLVRESDDGRTLVRTDERPLYRPSCGHLHHLLCAVYVKIKDQSSNFQCHRCLSVL